MKVYLVGGAVRDELLGLPVVERDWCVVGSSPEEMAGLGFKPVGKDFPVFLHPDSGEEYALARTERKTAAGYHGFQFHTSPDVTILQDLQRRDLTINAMAIDENGVRIDPFGGAADIEARCLRHVSGAFAEDPVRLLRVARFAARFSQLGFSVADETLSAMSAMVDNGEIDALVPDRVWKETESALGTKSPQVFFEVLRACGALHVLFPEIDRLFGVPQPEKWHPEIDTGVHVMMVMEQAARLDDHTDTRFAALFHDVGKAATKPASLPTHHGHEARGVKIIRRFCERLPVPVAFRDLALLVAEYHGHAHRALELRPATLLRVLLKTDALRRPGRFEKFVLACEADARGRTGLENREYPQADYLRGALACLQAVSLDSEIIAQHSGADIGKAVSAARLDALTEYRKLHQLPK